MTGSRSDLAAAGGHRLITKDPIVALMDFGFWCSPEELDTAIDRARKGEKEGG